MLASNLYFPTLKETPADAELISHKLMLRAGLIRKLASGLYTWLPLGLKVLHNVSKIVREEMEKIGAQEILMPAVQPSELWQESGRWEEYGKELLRFNDRHDRDFCFGPTHEEVITDLVRNELSSYKHLPKTFYQIQTKFRDEIRPRFGLMRAREFLMKDAYSFHLDEKCLEKTYNEMYKAYTNIFKRIGLEFRAVLADTGSIGGNTSHEFHALAESGEDAIAFSTGSDYAANVEFATAKLAEENTNSLKELGTASTPNIIPIVEQAKHMGVQTKEVLKTILVKGSSNENPVVALAIRGDHELNPILATKSELVANPLELISEEEVNKIANCKPGFVGPKDLNIPLIVDKFAHAMQNFSCGKNQTDEHYINVNWDRDIAKPHEVRDLRVVTEGDISPDGKGELKIARGIELGHIFMLGDKYSKAMNASVLDEAGKSRNFMMGCYGIGVSRIVAGAIEQHFDDKGIVWPFNIAPYKVAIVAIDYQRNEEVKNASLSLYNKLNSLGIETLLDDRKERPGVKFKDMDLIGVPFRVVISSKTLEKGKFEFKLRNEDEALELPEEEIMTKIAARVAKSAVSS